MKSFSLIALVALSLGIYAGISEQKRAAEHAEALHLSTVAWQGYASATRDYEACLRQDRVELCEAERVHMELHREDAHRYSVKGMPDVGP